MALPENTSPPQESMEQVKCSDCGEIYYTEFTTYLGMSDPIGEPQCPECQSYEWEDV